MCDHRPRPGLSPASSRALAARAALALCAALAGCVPDPAERLLPPSDLKPPLVLEAGPEGSRSFRLRFDEEVRPVEGSFALEPGPRAASASAEGSLVLIDFGFDLEAGADYAVSGEAEDAAGNATRFVFSFAGWNGRPARLRLSEAQTAKNASLTKPHRDYLEFVASEDGNLGGEEVSWANSVRRFSYRFPGIEVRAGDFVVLHLAPEGIPEEKDERDADLARSGGVDATSGARDLWSAAGGLPDASGAVVLRARAGDPAYEGLFYADEAKTGSLGDDKLAALVAELSEAWPLAAAPSWEDAFRWNPSTARSLCRDQAVLAAGAGAWYVGAAGAQSPGAANAPRPTE